MTPRRSATIRRTLAGERGTAVILTIGMMVFILAMIGVAAYGRKSVQPATHAVCSTNGQPRNRTHESGQDQSVGSIAAETACAWSR